MIHDRLQLEALATYYSRVQGLIREGYRIVFRTEDKELICHHLVHRNGNRIFVRLNFKDGILYQLTNGRCVSKEKVC